MYQTTDETTKARLELVSLVLTIVALLTLLKLGLLTALVAGLLIYHLVHLVTPALGNLGVTASWRKTVALTILVALIASLLAFGVIKLMNTLNAGLDGITELLRRMAGELPSHFAQTVVDTVIQAHQQAQRGFTLGPSR